jgi:hypothetical protein
MGTIRENLYAQGDTCICSLDSVLFPGKCTGKGKYEEIYRAKILRIQQLCIHNRKMTENA